MDPPNQMVMYFDSYSILVINQQGKIRRLYTPFCVQCIDSIDDIQVNTRVYVDEVFPDEDDLLLFKVCGNLYDPLLFTKSGNSLMTAFPLRNQCFLFFLTSLIRFSGGIHI
jgi:hypothetical protein